MASLGICHKLQTLCGAFFFLTNLSLFREVADGRSEQEPSLPYSSLMKMTVCRTFGLAPESTTGKNGRLNCFCATQNIISCLLHKCDSYQALKIKFVEINSPYKIVVIARLPFPHVPSDRKLSRY